MITSPIIPRPDWLPESVWPFDIRALDVPTLDVQATTVAYTDAGQGPTLVFSHAGLWSFLWRDVIRELSAHYRCVTFDPPGSGLSDRVGPTRQSLDTVRDTIGAIIDTLDLRDITLVMHDLGGVTALAAAAARSDRFVGLVPINTFGWRPSEPLLRAMLAVFGSTWMRGLDAWTGFLPAGTTTRFGIGRNLDRPSRRAFRRGLDREARQVMHRLFASARTSPEVYRDAEHALRTDLRRLPLLTIFGAWSDYVGFQPGWKQRFPDARQLTVGRFHFPMMDDPAQVADAIGTWHTDTVVHRDRFRRSHWEHAPGDS